MQYFGKENQVSFHIFLCIQIVSILIQRSQGGQYCAGGYDPICYFPDENELLEEARLRLRRKPDSKENELQELSFQDYGKVVSKRDDGDDDQSAGSTTGTDASQGDSGDTKKGTDDKTSSASTETDIKDSSTPKKDSSALAFIPLNDTEIKHPKLQMYPESDDMEWIYPPWTYQGFHSPSEWDKIPAWYFLPKQSVKIGKYTGTTMNKKSGISFMDFKEIWKPQETAGGGKKRKLTEDAEQGGVSSKNCSDTKFPAPLDILTGNAMEDSSFVEFDFHNQDTIYAFVMYLPEDGTDLLFVKLQTPPKQVNMKPSIENGATTGSTLYLDRFLIHYGMSPDEGSEHRINGRSYGMELQFFFNFQTKQTADLAYFHTLENYISDKDNSQFGKNLMVLCILVEVAPKTQKTPPKGKEYNKGMSYLSMAAEEFSATKNEQKFRSFAIKKKVLKISDFFKEPTSGLYYSYYGSLTHPPCLNNTRYAVFENPIYISHSDWRNFLFIPSQFSDTQFVAGNFRPMDTMTVMSNYTKMIVPYDHKMKVNLSFTIRKSRRATALERNLEYDYYE